MAESIVRMEEWGGSKEKRLKRAVIMHGTSRYREEGARLLAEIVQESGAQGAAFGWTDDLAPDLLAPVHVVTAAPHVRWDTKLSRTLAPRIDADSKLSWKLMLRGGDEARIGRLGPLLSFTAGWFSDAGHRDCPKIHGDVADGPCARFIALLDAYRFVGFRIGNAGDVPFFQAEFRLEIPNLPDAARHSAEAVVRVLAKHDRLSGALLDLGIALDLDGALAEAASVHLIGYELALQRCDSGAGIDAARGAGRAYRLLAEWDESFRWYGLARRVAEFEEDWTRLAIALDGTGNIHRERGSFPAARQYYEDAWRVAIMSGDPVAIGNVSHSMMTVEREAGRLMSAAGYGWKALQAQTDPDERANLLLNIGTLLRDGGDVGTATDAYHLVRVYSRDRNLRMMAADALAYCAALQGRPEYSKWQRVARRESKGAPPYLRAQIGYFRGASLRALGREDDAVRALRAVERYARSAGLSEWRVKSAESAEQPPPRPVPIETPAELRQGLRELREAAV